VFAAFQAAAGYAFSALFNASGGNHRLLFLIAAIALVVALLADLGTGLVKRYRGGGTPCITS
jgi:MFS superfamily sulfate permease-like transporter